MAVLKVSNLTKHYRMGQVTITALSGVNLAVEKGEFVAIMGPSGSGKSTLLHLLGGLEGPSAGEIMLVDQTFSQLSDDEVTLIRRRRVGFIFQFFNLLPTLTAWENVALPLTIDGQNPGKHREKVDGLLALVGLSDRKHHRPDQLSGGQQQRVAIARALVNDPEVVLADEPTGNLDSRSGQGVLDLLHRICHEFGATIIMVTHDARAASYADRAVFLRDGAIVRQVRPALTSADYKR